MRIEGYLPENGEPSTAPLYLYWNQVETSQKDNLVTTDPQVHVCGQVVRHSSLMLMDVSLRLDMSAVDMTMGSCLRFS
jgi:hypothetical protein